jgi:hypothetical protein
MAELFLLTALGLKYNDLLNFQSIEETEDLTAEDLE